MRPRMPWHEAVGITCNKEVARDVIIAAHYSYHWGGDTSLRVLYGKGVCKLIKPWIVMPSSLSVLLSWSGSVKVHFTIWFYNKQWNISLWRGTWNPM